MLVICELKMSFNLELVLQGVERATSCDEVWLAAQLSVRGKGREADRRFRRSAAGWVSVSRRIFVRPRRSAALPDAPQPRRNLKKRSRIVAEYNKRQGRSRRGRLARADHDRLSSAGAGLRQRDDGRPEAPARSQEGHFPAPAASCQHNVYGWFARAERGIYELTEAGRAALLRWPQAAQEQG